VGQLQLHQRDLVLDADLLALGGHFGLVDTHHIHDWALPRLILAVKQRKVLVGAVQKPRPLRLLALERGQCLLQAAQRAGMVFVGLRHTARGAFLGGFDGFQAGLGAKAEPVGRANADRCARAAFGHSPTGRDARQEARAADGGLRDVAVFLGLGLQHRQRLPRGLRNRNRGQPTHIAQRLERHGVQFCDGGARGLKGRRGRWCPRPAPRLRLRRRPWQSCARLSSCRCRTALGR